FPRDWSSDVCSSDLDVPTFAEGGVPDFDLNVWNAIAVPAGTPAPAVRRLEQALAAALRDPDVQASLEKLAAQAPAPQDQGSAALQALLERDVPRFAALIEQAGVPVN